MSFHNKSKRMSNLLSYFTLIFKALLYTSEYWLLNPQLFSHFVLGHSFQPELHRYMEHNKKPTYNLLQELNQS